MDLSTTETDVSSVGNKFTQIERRCRDDCMNCLLQQYIEVDNKIMIKHEFRWSEM